MSVQLVLRYLLENEHFVKESANFTRLLSPSWGLWWDSLHQIPLRLVR